MREIVLIRYYNVYFYLSFQTGKDEIYRDCLVKRIDAGESVNMKELADWCDCHQITFYTKFIYRKDYPLKANVWNLYSYYRFLFEKWIAVRKR